LNIFTEQCDYLKKSVGLKINREGFFRRLYEQYYDRDQIAAFASKVNNTYIGSGLIVGNRQMTHLWVAGKARDADSNVPRQELIVWESIKWAKKIGSKYFDLCIIEPERLPSIAQFKFGFTGYLVPFYFATYKRIGYRVLSKLSKVI
jgi:hypothetical protein